MEHLQCFLCEEFATGPKLEMCVFACFFVSLLVSWLVNQSVSEFSQLVRFFVGLEDFFHQPKKTIKKTTESHRNESPGRFECRNLYEVAAEMPENPAGGGSWVTRGTRAHLHQTWDYSCHRLSGFPQQQGFLEP